MIFEENVALMQKKLVGYLVTPCGKPEVSVMRTEEFHWPFGQDSCNSGTRYQIFIFGGLYGIHTDVYT